MRARLTFDGDHLATIVNMENNRQFGFFRLDPRLITMISSPNGEQRLFVPRSGFPDFAGGYFAGDRRPSFLRAWTASASTPSDVRCWQT
ncbi:penicillin-binding protein 1B [includes: penicillin-insensitive transglycosylase; penicillin sensitive transpeptidase] [Escherichia coli]|uniref:Penicillin-binding protein 1B [includes: penicillin-insensitive transglycosylase penicillin sensitive transpeptidase] n=1 Tax=Escherichia coli TaxID=562 RepID=A0A2X1JLU9_ECOLX|nr:penicillin-binding protein 1B [includes: penicillin-insensitive transglycosylase; penicillin sensitive transpeptidase] [Escherichia coli]